MAVTHDRARAHFKALAAEFPPEEISRRLALKLHAAPPRVPGAAVGVGHFSQAHEKVARPGQPQATSSPTLQSDDAPQTMLATENAGSSEDCPA